MPCGNRSIIATTGAEGSRFATADRRCGVTNRVASMRLFWKHMVNWCAGTDLAGSSTAWVSQVLLLTRNWIDERDKN
jgi:hypothetical protein